MRNDERETDPTTPPAVRPAVARVQPATIVAPGRAEQARNASGIFDGFVHSNDPPETHRFDLLVREVLADEAGNLSVGLRQLAFVGLGTNLLRDPIVVLEEHALEDGDLGGDTGGRPEVRRTKHALGVIPDPEAFALEPFDPLGTGRAVGRNAEMAIESLDDGVRLAGRKVGRCEFSTHGFVSLPLVGHFHFPLIRGGTMGRSGHSQERPSFKPLLATTTSQVGIRKLVSKNYP